jgi:hypothetical protein
LGANTTGGTTYTLTAGGAGAKIIIAGATITVPADGTSGADITTDGKASIVLGTGSIVLGSAVTGTPALVAGTFSLVNGGKIGVFGTGMPASNAAVETITGGVVLGNNKAGALSGASTNTVNVTITVGADGAADAVISTTSIVTMAG